MGLQLLIRVYKNFYHFFLILHRSCMLRPKNKYHWIKVEHVAHVQLCNSSLSISASQLWLCVCNNSKPKKRQTNYHFARSPYSVIYARRKASLASTTASLNQLVADWWKNRQKKQCCTSSWRTVRYVVLCPGVPDMRKKPGRWLTPRS